MIVIKLYENFKHKMKLLLELIHMYFFVQIYIFYINFIDQYINFRKFNFEKI